MYPILLGVISVRGLAMSLADVSTARLVLDAQRLDTKTTHAPRDINVLTVEKSMHHTTKSAVIIRGNLIFNISEYQKMYFCSKLVQFIKQNSWTEVDELCWGHRGSNPMHISMYTDRCFVGWGSACYTEATSCCYCY